MNGNPTTKGQDWPAKSRPKGRSSQSGDLDQLQAKPARLSSLLESQLSPSLAPNKCNNNNTPPFPLELDRTEPLTPTPSSSSSEGHLNVDVAAAICHSDPIQQLESALSEVLPYLTPPTSPTPHRSSSKAVNSLSLSSSSSPQLSPIISCSDQSHYMGNTLTNCDLAEQRGGGTSPFFPSLDNMCGASTSNVADSAATSASTPAADAVPESVKNDGAADEPKEDIEHTVPSGATAYNEVPATQKTSATEEQMSTPLPTTLADSIDNNNENKPEETKKAAEETMPPTKEIFNLVPVTPTAKRMEEQKHAPVPTKLVDSADYSSDALNDTTATVDLADVSSSGEDTWSDNKPVVVVGPAGDPFGKSVALNDTMATVDLADVSSSGEDTWSDNKPVVVVGPAGDPFGKSVALNDTMATVDLADVSSSGEDTWSDKPVVVVGPAGDPFGKSVAVKPTSSLADAKPWWVRRRYLLLAVLVILVAVISSIIVSDSRSKNNAAVTAIGSEEPQYDSEDGGNDSFQTGPGIREETLPPTSSPSPKPTALLTMESTTMQPTAQGQLDIAALTTSTPTVSATVLATAEQSSSSTSGVTNAETTSPIKEDIVDITSSTNSPLPTLLPTVGTDEPTFAGIEPTSEPTITAIRTGENDIDQANDGPQQYDTFSFYVMGDAPYSQAEEILVREQLAEISKGVTSEDMFLFHVGDMMRAKTTNCRRRNFQFIEDAFTQELPNLPVFLIPGDNDTNDCPHGAWDYWLEYFMQFERNYIGVRSFLTSVERQPERQENLAFVLNGVLMIGLNQVGGIEEPTYQERLDHNEAWIDEQVDRYETDMKNGRIRLCIIFAHSGKGMRVFRHIAKRLSGFPFPTMILKGDGHNFSASNTIKGVGWDLFKSVQVDAGGKAPPIKVTVQGTNKEAKENPILNDGEGVQVLWDLVRLDRRGGLYSNYVEEDFEDE